MSYCLDMLKLPLAACKPTRPLHQSLALLSIPDYCRGRLLCYVQAPVTSKMGLNSREKGNQTHQYLIVGEWYQDREPFSSLVLRHGDHFLR